MPDGQVIEFTRVTKRFGGTTAVSDFSARIEPGLVTGFLGPNGAGKTTSLRMLLGLVRPSSGRATIGGRAYADLADPLREVGAALEAASFHPGRSGANHLKVYARAAGLPDSRVDEVLGLVGLADAAGRKVGGYSLGMRQRLGLATALLGDPGVVVLDEPANGLDPEGIRWMRTFLRSLAREGRTVLTSSHLLAEVAQTAHALVIISQGRLVFQGGLSELAVSDEMTVVVDAPDRAALVHALQEAEVPFQVLRSGLSIRGGDTAAIGEVAARAGVALSSLHRRGPALEEVFLELVNGLRVHPSANGVIGTLEAGSAPAAEPVPGPLPQPGATDTATPDTTAASAPEQPATDSATGTRADGPPAAPAGAAQDLRAEAPEDPDGVEAAEGPDGPGEAVTTDEPETPEGPETTDGTEAPVEAETADEAVATEEGETR